MITFFIQESNPYGDPATLASKIKAGLLGPGIQNLDKDRPFLWPLGVYNTFIFT